MTKSDPCDPMRRDAAPHPGVDHERRDPAVCARAVAVRDCHREAAESCDRRRVRFADQWMRGFPAVAPVYQVWLADALRVADWRWHCPVATTPRAEQATREQKVKRRAHRTAEQPAKVVSLVRQRVLLAV